MLRSRRQQCSAASVIVRAIRVGIGGTANFWLIREPEEAGGRSDFGTLDFRERYESAWFYRDVAVDRLTRTTLAEITVDSKRSFAILRHHGIVVSCPGIVPDHLVPPRTMYLDQISIQNFRTFGKMRAPVQFLHPDLNFSEVGLPTPRLRNVNLLLGDNGSGKTSMLKSVALAALGPAVGRSGIYPYKLVRIQPKRDGKGKPDPTLIEAEFIAHEQDGSEYPRVESLVEVVAEVDLEYLEWRHDQDKVWHPVFSSRSDAMFVVGYGCNRRIEKPERSKSHRRASERAQRVMSLFEEDYSLRPLNTWLPELRHSNQKHHDEVVQIIDRLLGKKSYTFKGEQDSEDEYVFDQRTVQIPFPALSDG